MTVLVPIPGFALAGGFHYVKLLTGAHLPEMLRWLADPHPPQWQQQMIQATVVDITGRPVFASVAEVDALPAKVIIALCNVVQAVNMDLEYVLPCGTVHLENGAAAEHHPRPGAADDPAGSARPGPLREWPGGRGPAAPPVG